MIRLGLGYLANHVFSTAAAPSSDVLVLIALISTRFVQASIIGNLGWELPLPQVPSRLLNWHLLVSLLCDQNNNIQGRMRDKILVQNSTYSYVEWHGALKLRRSSLTNHIHLNVNENARCGAAK